MMKRAFDANLEWSGAEDWLPWRELQKRELWIDGIREKSDSLSSLSSIYRGSFRKDCARKAKRCTEFKVAAAVCANMVSTRGSRYLNVRWNVLSRQVVSRWSVVGIWCETRPVFLERTGRFKRVFGPISDQLLPFAKSKKLRGYCGGPNREWARC